MENPRERVINSFSNGKIDFETLMDVLQGQITNTCKNDETYWKKVESGIEEFSDNDAQFLDEPLETIRKLAIITDMYSNLAHVHDETTGEYNRVLFLRGQKDFLMRQLVIKCIEANKKEDTNIIFGYIPERHKESLEIDIPNLGHVGWHFGRLHNLNGLKADIQNETGVEIPVYPYSIEPKVTKKSGVDYTNIETLRGVYPPNDLNDVDRYLVLYGTRTPPSKNPKYEIDR